MSHASYLLYSTYRTQKTGKCHNMLARGDGDPSHSQQHQRSSRCMAGQQCIKQAPHRVESLLVNANWEFRPNLETLQSSRRVRSCQSDVACLEARGVPSVVTSRITSPLSEGLSLMLLYWCRMKLATCSSVNWLVSVLVARDH